MKFLSVVAPLLLVVSSVAAQQTGDANRDYTINATGSGGTSPVITAVGVPSQSLDNVYTTSDPWAPLVWIYATSSLIDWVPGVSANSVDIGPADLAFLLDGIGPGPLSPLLVTGAAGAFGIELNLSAALAGASFDLAMAHLSASSPDLFYISQTHRVSFISDPSLSPASGGCTPLATVLSLSDDATVFQTIGFNLDFYGATYTRCFVGSNGHITFGASTTSWVTGDLATFADPIIATLSEDLNPASGGTVTFHTDNTSIFEVCFTSVPSWPNVGSNSFKTTFQNGAAIIMDYLSITEHEGTVGLSPGSGTAPSSMPINLSVGSAVIPPNTAPWEHFDSLATPPTLNDLDGFQLTWVLDPLGHPIMQF